MKINLYVKDNCFKCKNAEVRLDANQVEYGIINIDHDEAAYKVAKESGFSSLPLVEVDGNIIFNDLNIPKLDQLIKDYRSQLVPSE